MRRHYVTPVWVHDDPALGEAVRKPLLCQMWPGDYGVSADLVDSFVVILDVTAEQHQALLASGLAIEP